MRVTNTQVKADAICELYCPDCELAMSNPEEWHCPHGGKQVRAYALDLLESREIIKEMREVIEAYAHGMKYDMNAIRVKADALLEKSKEFA